MIELPHRTGHIHGHDTMISVWEEHVTESMFSVFGAVVQHLHAQGFTVRACPTMQKRYRCLSRTTRIGRKGDLEYELQLRGRVLELTFFQNVNIENPNGGKYDFRKLHRMSRTMRLQCLTEMTRIVRLYLSMGYDLGRKAFPIALPLPFAIRHFAEQRTFENPLDNFNANWNFESDWARGGRFKRDETGWPTFSEYGQCHNTDRDKRPIRNGEQKYYRHWDGYLLRATVFTNMNNMWCCESGAGRHYVSSRELFDCDRPELLPRRHKKDQEARLQKMLTQAVEAKDYARVGVLSRVLQRSFPQLKEAI